MQKLPSSHRRPLLHREQVSAHRPRSPHVVSGREAHHHRRSDTVLRRTSEGSAPARRRFCHRHARRLRLVPLLPARSRHGLTTRSPRRPSLAARQADAGRRPQPLRLSARLEIKPNKTGVGMLPRLVSMLCRRSRAQMPLRGAASCVPSRQDVHRAGLGFVIALLLLLLAVRAPFAAAQGLDPATLLRPATDTWPTYNGDYSGARFSTLDQINAGNVGSLAPAWVCRAHGAVLKSTPLEVNGILYFSAPDNVWAIDARFGRQIWHYQRTSEGDHIGHRGLGMYKDWLYFTTP